MPIYEYKCEECGVVSDLLIKNTAKSASVSCPGCQSTHMTRLISVPGAVMSKSKHGADESMGHGCPHRERCGMDHCPGGMH